MAPAAASDETTTDSELQTNNAFFFDDDPDFIVEIEDDVEADDGEDVTVDLDIEPTDDSSQWFVPQNDKINWYLITVEYDEDALDFAAVADSEVGEIRVVDESPGEVTLKNGYDFGDFFLDPDKAPATLAALEFAVSGEEGEEATIEATEDSKVGWGPDFLKELPVFQHDVDFESGSVVIGESDDDDDEDGEPEAELDAVNTGGFVAFDEDSESDAREEGIEFPEAGIQIEGEFDTETGTWESTDVEFPPVEAEGLEAEVEAVDGLEGEIDREDDLLTAEGTLEVSVFGDSFDFDIAATTEQSGALTGEADLGSESGTATLVDNDFTVSASGNLLVDESLNLPIEDPNQNWIELPLELEFTDGDDDDDEPEEGSLDLSVVDQDGDAIEGASVSGDGVEETTDADGQIAVDLEPGTYDLTVEAEGETESLSVDIGDGETVTETVEIELPPETGDLEVEVVDQDGDALAGADVTVDGETVETDDAGVATFDDLEVGEYEVTVEAEGETETTQASVEADAVTSVSVTVELPPEPGSLELTVVDQDGDTIEGASVSGDGVEETTDADGQIEVELEVGTYDLTVEAEGETESLSVDIGDGETVTETVEIELPPETGDLEVEVVDQDDSPLEATIEVDGESVTAADGTAAFELEAGEYDVTVEAAGETRTVSATVSAEETETLTVEIEVETIEADEFTAESDGGFISFDEDNLDDAVSEGISFPDGSGEKDPIQIDADIDTEDGTWEADADDVDFPVLNTEADGSGFDAQATAPDGLEGEFDPVAGVATAQGTLQIELALTGDTFSFDIDMTTGVSDGQASEEGLEGEFDVDEDGGLLTFVDNEYTVPEETGNDLLDQQLGLPLTESGLAWLELPLDVTFDPEPEDGTLALDVIDQNGDAIEGASVTGDGVEETTDADGQIEVDLEPGTYDLTVEAEGETDSLSVDIGDGETVTETVEIELPPETGTLEIEVVDQDGDAIAGADVTVDDETVQTDDSGVVSIDDLEVGSYDVTVEAEGESTTTSAEIDADSVTSETITFDLTPDPGTLEVTVSDQDGAGVDATVTLNDGEQSAETGEDGTASFELQPGDYTVTVEAEGETLSEDVEINEDETSSVDFALDLVEEFDFTATNTGGFISFDEDNIDDAIDEGLTFPTEEEDGDGLFIEATAEDGQWSAAADAVEFPTLHTEEDGSGFAAETTAPDGLEGEIDRDNNVMTVQGTLVVELPLTGDSFQFDIDMTTGVSDGAASEDGLEGDADFADGTATLVDNEYVVPEPTGNPLLDDQLGLPLEDPGLAWLELPFDFEFEDE